MYYISLGYIIIALQKLHGCIDTDLVDLYIMHYS